MPLPSSSRLCEVTTTTKHVCLGKTKTKIDGEILYKRSDRHTLVWTYANRHKDQDTQVKQVV